MFRNLKRWFLETPDRSLDQAYSAALKIKAIEDEHFDGREVCADNTEYGDNVLNYFCSEVQQNLNIATRRLAEFKASRSFVNLYTTQRNYRTSGSSYYGSERSEQSAIILEKLNFIDLVIAKYQSGSLSRALVVTQPENNSIISSTSFTQNKQLNLKPKDNSSAQNLTKKSATVSDKTGVLPRSIFRTFQRIKREIDPQSSETEEEVVRKFRSSRNKTIISIKFLLILTIVPLLTHQVTKTFLVKPVVETYFEQHQNHIIFINSDLEEEALIELKNFEETLRLKSLIGWAPEMTSKEIKEEVQHEAAEIVEQYRHQGIDAIQNIFADLFSLMAFTGVLLVSKKEIAALKSFIDEIIYGLSDSAKAFLIILFTDIFVGYHSPHGWEIILEGIARHFGLPENREFNFLFIATFPVILDTVLKYWIFRYLNRISPSAVATYRNMNE